MARGTCYRSPLQAQTTLSGACWRIWRTPKSGPPLFLFGASPIQDSTKRVRVNRQIRISPLRVIAPDGSQLGIIELETALAQAEAQGLDLVEVAPLARPPVGLRELLAHLPPLLA